MTPPVPVAPGREAWQGVRALVAGLGPGGLAAADSLLFLGADVVVVDPQGERTDRLELLETLGARLLLGEAAAEAVPAEADLVIAAPGLAPDAPLLVAAASAGVPVWDELELAWRLRDADAAPWILVAGEDASSTTSDLLEAMLLAAGLRAWRVGTEGSVPALEAVMDPEGQDVLVVVATSHQLARTSSPSPVASLVRSVDGGPLGWHVDAAARTAALAQAYENTVVACVYDADEPRSEVLVEEADVVEGCRAVGFTAAIPAPSMVGLVDDAIADRAFVPGRQSSAAEVGSLRDLTTEGEPDPALVRDALAAAALARALGVPPSAVRDGLRAHLA